MQIGLRRMPRVARLGKQSKIGQAKLRHHLQALRVVLDGCCTQPGGIDKTADKRQPTQTKENQGAIDRTGHSNLRTVAATLSAGVPSSSNSASLPSGPIT